MLDKACFIINDIHQSENNSSYEEKIIKEIKSYGDNESNINVLKCYENYKFMQESYKNGQANCVEEDLQRNNKNILNFFKNLF